MEKIRLDTANSAVSVIFYSDVIARVTFGEPKSESMIVTGKPADVKVSVRETEDGYELSTEKLTLRVSKASGYITFETKDGKKLSGIGGHRILPYDIYRTEGGSVEVRKTVDGERATVKGSEKKFVRTSNHAYITVDFSDDESVFGLGSHEEGYAEVRGEYIPLYQENMRIALPYMVSSLGYAYLFDCTSYMTFDGTSKTKGEFYFDSVDNVDFYFISGDGYDDICRSYRDLTGETPMLPKWALGYIQSRERYVDQNHLLENARKYNEIGTPIDAIIQDWLYWNPACWGDKHFTPDRYPDPTAMINELHDMDIRFMISIWPNMHGETADKKEFREAKLLLADDAIVDVFRREARELYWRHANEGLFCHGVDGWWCDSSEPYDAVWHGAERAPLPERMKISTDEFKKYLDDGIINAYSLHHSMGMYENQRKCSDKRLINLTRSGFPGQHRYGTVVWSGDVSAKWETLRRQIHILQNYVAAGEGNWNSDVGAFFVRGGREWFRDGDYPEGKDDLGYRELYTRWLQFAVFTPFMRSHGTDTPREVWQFGERGEVFRDAIEGAIALRYKLLPYFYSVMAKMRFEGTMPVAPLALAFPEDRGAHEAKDEYMYGPSLLVCPVYRAMMYGPGSVPIEDDGKIEVYLPVGGWYDFYTEKYYEGGRKYKIDAPIDRIPLFVKAGAILPVAPPVTRTGQLDGKEFEIRVYGGADGEFTLYDDRGDGYEYENGDYTMQVFSYSDSDGKITENVLGTEKYRHPTVFRIIK